jgi:hypothetical protein
MGAYDDEVRRHPSGLVDDFAPGEPGPNVHKHARPRGLPDLGGDRGDASAPVLEQRQCGLGTELRSRRQVKDVELSGHSIGHADGCGFDDA